MMRPQRITATITRVHYVVQVTNRRPNSSAGTFGRWDRTFHPPPGVAVVGSKGKPHLESAKAVAEFLLREGGRQAQQQAASVQRVATCLGVKPEPESPCHSPHSHIQVQAPFSAHHDQSPDQQLLKERHSGPVHKCEHAAGPGPDSSATISDLGFQRGQRVEVALPLMTTALATLQRAAAAGGACMQYTDAVEAHPTGKGAVVGGDYTPATEVVVNCHTQDNLLPDGEVACAVPVVGAWEEGDSSGYAELPGAIHPDVIGGGSPWATWQVPSRIHGRPEGECNASEDGAKAQCQRGGR